MNTQNSHEQEGHRLYDLERHKDALGEYKRAMKGDPPPTVKAYLMASKAISIILGELAGKSIERNKAGKSTNTAIFEELLQEQKTILRKGVALFKKEDRLWASLAVVCIMDGSHAESLEATRKMVSVAKKIVKSNLQYTMAGALFMGHIEICTEAVPKYLCCNNAYRKIKCDGNPLAEILSVFGPVVCDEHMIEGMLKAWSANGSWNTDPENSGTAEEFSLVAMFKREDIRVWVLALPDFRCPYLNKVAVIFQIIVNYFNNDMDAVKKLFLQNLPEDTAILNWILRMAEEIADEEDRLGRFDQDYMRWLPDFKTASECALEYDKSIEQYGRFLLALAHGKYTEAIEMKQQLKFAIRITKYESEKAWNGSHKCIGNGNINGAVRILYTYLRKEWGRRDNFPVSAFSSVLFVLLYSKDRFDEARAVMPEVEESHILYEYVKRVTECKPIESYEQESALHVAKAKAMESFDGLQKYLKQYPPQYMQELLIVKKYARDPRRANEHDIITHFLVCLIFQETLLLGDGDTEKGTECLFSLLSIKDRGDIRKAIPKEISNEDFKSVWVLTQTLKRIEKILANGCLRNMFRKSHDFEANLATELIAHDWYKHSSLVATYREFLYWYVSEKLGIQHYSYLFSTRTAQKDAGKESEKREKNVVLSEAQVQGVAEALSKEKSPDTDEWKLLVSRKKHSARQAINLTKEEFVSYFANDFIGVNGIDILKKLKYFLMFDKYQMARGARIIVYPNYIKLRLGEVRILCNPDIAEKKIHFFVENRRDGYQQV